MAIVPNKWMEKERKKKEPVTAPSYSRQESKSEFPDFIPVNDKKPVKRFSKCLKTNFVRTLRGVRK